MINRVTSCAPSLIVGKSGCAAAARIVEEASDKTMAPAARPAVSCRNFRRVVGTALCFGKEESLGFIIGEPAIDWRRIQIQRTTHFRAERGLKSSYLEAV